jgi:hypothetical protein
MASPLSRKTLGFSETARSLGVSKGSQDLEDTF